jgi:hypothetical protein
MTRAAILGVVLALSGAGAAIATTEAPPAPPPIQVHIATGNPWRRVFNFRVRLRTFRYVEHACQKRARRLTFQTAQPVLCENPDPSQYALFNTGWRRCEIQGWYDVAWQDGPQKGLIFRYSRWMFFKGGITANPKRTGSFPWDGPFVIQRPHNTH